MSSQQRKQVPWRLAGPWWTFGLCVQLAYGCASSGSNAPTHTTTAKTVKAEQPALASEHSTVAPSGPIAEPICGAFDSEEAAANAILMGSGSGLLSLVVPTEGDAGNAQSRTQARRRSAEDVKTARKLADCLMRHIDAGFDQVQEQGFGAFEAWVDAHLARKHPFTMLASGAAYFASLLTADSRIDAVLDIPAALLLVEGAVAADPALYDGLGPLLLGAYECFMPQPIGGKPQQGLARLEQAAETPGRFRLAMKVAAAELCAYSLQDRPLFVRLLDEVLQGPSGTDPMIDLLAQAHARTLGQQADDLFFDDLEP